MLPGKRVRKTHRRGVVAPLPSLTMHAHGHLGATRCVVLALRPQNAPFLQASFAAELRPSYPSTPCKLHR